jgi:putative acetyltransferase
VISGVEIRPERTSDFEGISQVVESAFLGMPYADGDEAELVKKLRTQNALVVSLVAECEGALVGQVAFSPARTSAAAPGWYALGPVAVLPAHQGGGIGSALIRTGLQAIFDLGAAGCILTGNPAYYARFGFMLAPESAPPGEPPEFFMVKLLRGELPAGPIHFHEAFGHDA